MKKHAAPLVWMVLGLAISAGHAAPAKPAPAKPAPARPAPAKTIPAKAPAKQAQAKPASPPADPGLQKIAYPGGVTALRDLVYAALPGFRPLTLDLYQPRPEPKDFPRPLVIFVHGGAWNSGDARHGGGFDDFPAVLAALAGQNYVVASIDYRLSGEAHYPAALQDVKSAILWLRAHAGDYNIDTTRIAIWGEEAGGQLAALAGTSCGVALLEPPKSGTDKDPSDCVQAVIDWHGISDLETLAADSGDTAKATAQGAFLGCEPAGCAPGLVRTANPITYIGASSPPFLIQHGSHKVVPMAQSQKLADALTQAHVPVEFDTYADGDPDVAKKAMDQISAFLARNFPPAAPDKRAPEKKSGKLPY